MYTAEILSHGWQSPTFYFVNITDADDQTTQAASGREGILWTGGREGAAVAVATIRGTSAESMLTHRGPVDLRKWAIFNTILMSPKSWLSQEDLDAGSEHSMVPMDS